MVTIAAHDLAVVLGGRPVLDGVAATLAPGGLIGIIGPNGAGKSTLVRTLAGLLSPAQGAVTIDGTDVARLTSAQIGRCIAYLPQGATLHWPLSVERLVGLGRLPHLGPFSALRDDDRAAIREAMRVTGTLALAGRAATELSGGERARVMLARALATGAPALIADEPLAALDPAHQLDVMALLAGQAASGQLVVAVLHDLTLAARFCTRLLLLDRGHVAGDGAPAAVLTDAVLERVYGIAAWRGDADGTPLLVPLAKS